MMIENDSTDREPKRTKKAHRSPISNEGSLPSPHIPPEIIVDILSRLPVKSLLQFRSVCKSWRSLISNPQFVKTHLSIASKSNDYTHRRVIFTFFRCHFDLKSCSLYSVLYEQSDNAVELHYPLKDPHHSVSIVGSCNGLVCVASQEHAVCIWNPSTRKSKRLRDSGITLSYCCLVVYGFGYDESIDDYKVAGIFFVFGVDSFKKEVHVCTVKSDSWRRIGDFPYGITDESGKFANGALHWPAVGNTDSGNSWVIVSLDLAREVYGYVVQPNYGDGHFKFTLGVLEECLCVLSSFQGTRADVWIMKEYGMTESWTKLFSIPYLPNPRNYEYPMPLCISKNGEILLELGCRMIVYNPKKWYLLESCN